MTVAMDDERAVVADEQPSLTAAQKEVFDTLRATPGERPRFDPNLGRDIRGELNAALTALVPEDLEPQPLFVNKRKLAGVHGCRRNWLDEMQNDRFEWNPAIARGSVSHKAIELGIHWPGEASPMELVDEAMASFEHEADFGLGYWLQGVDPVVRAELRAGAVERVSAFQECFPPIEPSWTPVTESPSVCMVAQDRVKLSGKPDLTLGRAAGATAGKVIIDLKTGAPRPDHAADLRFYALVDTMKIGTPPRLLVSLYLDQARPVVQNVTTDVLESELRRVVDGVGHMIELLTGAREPDLSPSPACRWCPLLADCETGARHLDDEADRLGLEA